MLFTDVQRNVLYLPCYVKPGNPNHQEVLTWACHNNNNKRKKPNNICLAAGYTTHFSKISVTN